MSPQRHIYVYILYQITPDKFIAKFSQSKKQIRPMSIIADTNVIEDIDGFVVRFTSEKMLDSDFSEDNFFTHGYNFYGIPYVLDMEIQVSSK